MSSVVPESSKSRNGVTDDTHDSACRAPNIGNVELPTWTEDPTGFAEGEHLGLVRQMVQDQTRDDAVKA